jgi:hypothetical protein
LAKVISAICVVVVASGGRVAVSLRRARSPRIPKAIGMSPSRPIQWMDRVARPAAMTPAATRMARKPRYCPVTIC